MALTAEQISQNWEKHLEYVEKYITGDRKEKIKEFYNRYDERLCLMPASGKPQYHNCMVGGYIDHVNRVIEASLKIDQVWRELGVYDTYTTEELVFTAMMHDLGKFGTEDDELYIPQTDTWRKEKLNELYTYNDKIEFMSVPDRSLYILQTNGIEVSKNELLAIKLHDGMYEEANKPYLTSFAPETKPRTSLIFIIHQADILAARIEFEHEWFPKFGHKVSSSETKTKTKSKALKQKSSSELSKALNNFFINDNIL